MRMSASSLVAEAVGKIKSEVWKFSYFLDVFIDLGGI
jgi:hypothetical protein